MMNSIFAGKAMGIKSNIPSEEEIQENMMREQEQGRKKRMLFKQGSGTFDTSKILGSSSGKSFNIEAMLGGAKKKSTFDVGKFLTTGGNKVKTKGDNMKNYNNKLKQFGIMSNNKSPNMTDKLKQFGIGTIQKSKNNDIAAKLKQFGIGKTTKQFNMGKNTKKLKQFGTNSSINVNDKIRQFTGMNLKTGTGVKGFNVNDKIRQFTGMNLKTRISSISVNDKIRSFTGMNLKTGVRGVQKKATIKGIANTEAYGWNRIKQQRGLNPLGDFDGDKLVNMLDCNPRNKYKQGPMHEDDEMYPIANVEESNIITGPVEGEVMDVEGYETPLQEAIEPVEGDYADVTSEEESDVSISLGDVGQKIKQGLGAVGSGVGSAAKYVGGAIADKYERAKTGLNEIKEENRKRRNQEVLDEAKDRMLWEQGMKEKIKAAELKIKAAELRQRYDRVKKGTQPGYIKTAGTEIEAGIKKGVGQFATAGKGIPVKEPSKIRQLIGGSTTGAGIYQMSGRSGMIPFDEKVAIVAGRSGTEPFAAKVAAVTGKTGLEASESFPLKVDYYVGGGKKREQLLEQEKGVYEKLKEQIQAKRELQEEIAALSPIQKPISIPVQSSRLIPSQSSIYSPQQAESMPTTPTNIQTKGPTGPPPRPGMEWSDRSGRWVNYTRKPYDKNKVMSQPYIPQQTLY